LSAQVQSASSQGQNSAAQAAQLSGQIQALNASNTTLTSQITQLTAQIQELQNDLSFFIVPAGQTAAASVQVAVSGILSGGKPLYLVTNPEGVKVYVKNSADPLVRTSLQPLLTVTTTVQLAGTHNPGSSNLIVSEVNGQPIGQAPSTGSTGSPQAGSGQAPSPGSTGSPQASSGQGPSTGSGQGTPTTASPTTALPTE